MVDYTIKLDNAAPSLHSHYRNFITPTGYSAPVPRIGTLILVGPPLEFLPYHRNDRFPRSPQKPGSILNLVRPYSIVHFIMDHGRVLVEGKPLDLIRQHVGRDIIEVAEPREALKALMRSRSLSYEDLGHRLIIYVDDGNALYHEISKDHCEEGCIMRMATLEDVFLKLTGRELRE
jgi:hypothetical protein